MKKILQCFNFKKEYFCFVITTLLFMLIIYFYPKPFTVIGDILNKYSQGIIALSAIMGVLFSSSWLNTSKKKMKGKLDYDIARNYLKGILNLRDAIKIARNPFIPVSEMESVLEKDGLKYDESSEKDKKRCVYSHRWNKVQEAWTNFEEILIEAEISWGNEAVEIQKKIDMLIRKLRSIVWLFVNYPESFHKKGEENERLLYGTNNESDDFANEINGEINKIREFLKQYL